MQLDFAGFFLIANGVRGKRLCYACRLFVREAKLVNDTRNQRRNQADYIVQPGDSRTSTNHSDGHATFASRTETVLLCFPIRESNELKIPLLRNRCSKRVGARARENGAPTYKRRASERDRPIPVKSGEAIIVRLGDLKRDIVRVLVCTVRFVSRHHYSVKYFNSVRSTLLV